MTVTLKNVDQSLFEVLKSLVKMRQDVEIYEDDDKTAPKKNLSKQHIQQINNVYAKIPVEEQLFTTNASKAAIWEMIKDDTW